LFAAGAFSIYGSDEGGIHYAKLNGRRDCSSACGQTGPKQKVGPSGPARRQAGVERKRSNELCTIAFNVMALSESIMHSLMEEETAALPVGR